MDFTWQILPVNLRRAVRLCAVLPEGTNDRHPSDAGQGMLRPNAVPFSAQGLSLERDKVLPMLISGNTQHNVRM